MNQSKKIILIGEVCVDVTLTQAEQENKMRLGGVIHAARSLWAIDTVYDLLYIAPDYLSQKIELYARQHGAESVSQVGSIKGAPNVLLISEPKEVGNQGYELLLRDEYQFILKENALTKSLLKVNASDIIIFSGSFDLGKILAACNSTSAKIHIDAAIGLKSLEHFKILNKKIDTVILSTSSDFFLSGCHKSTNKLRDSLLGVVCENLLFKENRGGARFFQESEPDRPILVEAQIRPIVHSVGVGDCFNSIFIELRNKFTNKVALTYASWIAAEYASTTYPDDFKRECNRILQITDDEIVEIPGISLPWDVRQDYQIYIAAPDFDFMDTTLIKYVADSLSYHNFNPRLPVRENGQMEPDASSYRRRELFNADMVLLNKCQLVLAVLISNDPGTLVEIGLAAGLKIPVIIYDPYNIVHNPMLTEVPKLVSSNLDHILVEIFQLAAKWHQHAIS